MEKRAADNAKKFLFDTNDFGEEALRKKLEAAKRPTFSQAEMEASRITGYEQGRAAGIRETLDSQEAQIRDVLQQVVLAASRLEQGETQRLATFIEQSTLLSAQALTKACPALLNILALEQISDFVRSVLTEQVRGQALTIHVPADFADRIKERLDTMLQTMRRKASCTVVPDPTLSITQCRFEWTGGGAEWDPSKTAMTILDTIIAHMPEHLRGAVVTQPATMEAPAGVDASGQTPHTDTDLNDDVPKGDAT